MRVASVSLLLALSVPTLGAAEDVTRHAWGAPLSDRGPSVLLVEPCEFPCFAEVQFSNTIVANDGGILTHEATLTLDGVLIDVVVEQGGSRVPDVLRVRPPLGYMAEPVEVVVDDDALGSVRVMMVPIG